MSCTTQYRSNGRRQHNIQTQHGRPNIDHHQVLRTQKKAKKKPKTNFQNHYISAHAIADFSLTDSQKNLQTKTLITA